VVSSPLVNWRLSNLLTGSPTPRGLYIGKYNPPPWGGGNKYGLMGKKYHENNAGADKKGEKERKDKEKEKISDKKTEQKQCFIKLWETWKKMQAIGDIISYFFHYYFNCRAEKSTKIRLGENI
jgi:hypothetical protein